MDSACARPNGSHGYRYLRNDVVGFGGGGGGAANANFECHGLYNFYDSIIRERKTERKREDGGE